MASKLMKNNSKSLNVSLQAILFVLLTLFNFSCRQSSTCYEPTYIAMRGGFYYSDSEGDLQDTLLENGNIIFGETNTYYQNIKDGSKFSFPLSQIKDSIFFIFQADSNSTSIDNFDTIHLTYTRELKFISIACGYQHFFNLQSVIFSKHNIDTVIFSTVSVTNDINKEHIQLVVKN